MIIMFIISDRVLFTEAHSCKIICTNTHFDDYHIVRYGTVGTSVPSNGIGVKTSAKIRILMIITLLGTVPGYQCTVPSNGRCGHLFSENYVFL
jgi:hypothetical protein